VFDRTVNAIDGCYSFDRGLVDGLVAEGAPEEYAQCVGSSVDVDDGVVWQLITAVLLGDDLAEVRVSSSG